MNKTSLVEELPIGIYLAMTEDGKYIRNQYGDFLNIPAEKGDLKKVSELLDAARRYGVENPSVEFVSGSYRIDDDEYKEQVQRMAAGLMPDKNDINNLIDEAHKSQ